MDAAHIVYHVDCPTRNATKIKYKPGGGIKGGKAGGVEPGGKPKGGGPPGPGGKPAPKGGGGIPMPGCVFCCCCCCCALGSLVCWICLLLSLLLNSILFEEVVLPLVSC